MTWSWVAIAMLFVGADHPASTGSRPPGAPVTSGPRVAGRVTADGSPVPGAEILRHDRGWPYGIPLTRSRADGSFEVSLPEPGIVPILVDHPDHPVWQGSADPGTTFLEVRLAPGHELAGTVVDEAGRGVPARIRLFDPDDPDRFAWRSAEADARGRFRIRGLPAGAVRVAAVVTEHREDSAGTVRHHLARSTSAVVQPADGRFATLRLSVGGHGALIGRIAAPERGRARVTLMPVPYDWQRDHDDEDPDRFLFERPASYGGGYVGRDGRFEFRGLPRGRYTLRADLVDAARKLVGSAVREVVLDEDRDLDVGTLDPAPRP